MDFCPRHSDMINKPLLSNCGSSELVSNCSCANTAPWPFHCFNLRKFCSFATANLIQVARQLILQKGLNALGCNEVYRKKHRLKTQGSAQCQDYNSLQIFSYLPQAFNNKLVLNPRNYSPVNFYLTLGKITSIISLSLQNLEHKPPLSGCSYHLQVISA